MALTVDELFAIDAIELGMPLADLQAHFDAEENDVEIANEWNIDPLGQWYFPYTVNGIQCVLWDYSLEFILEYGPRVYTVTQNADIYEVYELGVYVGTLTVEGDIHFEQA